MTYRWHIEANRYFESKRNFTWFHRPICARALLNVEKHQSHKRLTQRIIHSHNLQVLLWSMVAIVRFEIMHIHERNTIASHISQITNYKCNHYVNPHSRIITFNDAREKCHLACIYILYYIHTHLHLHLHISIYSYMVDDCSLASRRLILPSTGIHMEYTKSCDILSDPIHQISSSMLQNMCKSFGCVWK